MSDSLDEDFKKSVVIPDDYQQQVLRAQFEQERQVIITNMNEIFQAVVLDATKDASKLPESIFEAVFLPFFCGDLSPEVSKTRTVEWISIAGSPMAEVQIIDENGNALFTVPPLFDSSSIDVSKKQGMSFPQLFEEYSLQHNYMPVVGNNFIMKALADKQNAYEGKSPREKESIDRWRQIMQRYDKIPQEIKSSNIPAAAEGDEDDLVYD